MSAALPYGFNTRSLFAGNPEEVLVGKVGGKAASDIEERWARASVGTDWQIAAFRFRIDPTGRYVENFWTNLPGEIEVDYLMTRGVAVQPVQIRGEISHFYSDWQQQVDDAKKAKIDEFGKSKGWLPTINVPARREDLYQLATQEQANITFRSVMG